MIRKAKLPDIEDAADIWLEANIKAHDFIPADYWEAQFKTVKELLAQAELYVYEGDGQDSREQRKAGGRAGTRPDAMVQISEKKRVIRGFIGMNGDHIEGIFVQAAERSKGIGKALIDHVKSKKDRLTLNVYQKNERARKFYEREGFVIQGEGTDPQTGETDLFMVWDRGTAINTGYDDEQFFDQYAQMPRSRDGLAGAGEWHQLKRLFPDVTGKCVLDLGCGYGWHCKYAALQGAQEVLGIDISGRMLEEAAKRNMDRKISYRLCSLEEYEYPKERWDLVISNLALHYIADLDGVYKKVYDTLKPGGAFLFNIEHPVFTSGVRQEWVYDDTGKPSHWPVDDYFYPGERVTQFLGCQVRKQHHTLTQILGGLLDCGFVIEAVKEAKPAEEMMDIPGMKDEMRRPMMLLVRAGKREKTGA